MAEKNDASGDNEQLPKDEEAVAALPLATSLPEVAGPTPRLTSCAEVHPDTVDNVNGQARTVLRRYFYERYSRDQEEDRIPTGTPPAPELTEQLPPVFSPETSVGRQLAIIGDDIQRRYDNQFTQMIKVLNFSGNGSDRSAYNTFHSVATSLFRDGHISWGRVIALFCFGYRIAVHQLTHGFSGMISETIGWITQFMMRQRISNWMAEQGGWDAIMNLMPETVSGFTLVSVAVVAALAIVLTFVIRRS